MGQSRSTLAGGGGGDGRRSMLLGHEPTDTSHIRLPGARSFVSLEMTPGCVYVVTLDDAAAAGMAQDGGSFAEGLARLCGSKRVRVLMPTAPQAKLFKDSASGIGGFPTCVGTKAMEELQQLQEANWEGFPASMTCVGYDRRMELLQDPISTLDSIQLPPQPSQELLLHHSGTMNFIRALLVAGLIKGGMRSPVMFRLLRAWTTLCAAYEILMQPRGHHVVVAAPDVAEDLMMLLTQHYGLAATYVQGRPYQAAAAVTVDTAVLDRRLSAEVIQPSYFLQSSLNPREDQSSLRLFETCGLLRLPDTVQDFLPVNFTLRLPDLTVRIVAENPDVDLRTTTSMQSVYELLAQDLDPRTAVVAVLPVEQKILLRSLIRDPEAAVSLDKYAYPPVNYYKATLQSIIEKDARLVNALPAALQEILARIMEDDSFAHWGGLWLLLQPFFRAASGKKTLAPQDFPDTVVMIVPMKAQGLDGKPIDTFGFGRYLESTFAAEIRAQPKPDVEQPPQAFQPARPAQPVAATEPTRAFAPQPYASQVPRTADVPAPQIPATYNLM